jgi:hypothetical protein
MQIVLTIDLPTDDTAELEQLISEATNATRPARAALGLALQGALFRASVQAMKDKASQ